jgi:hypothetical protein
MTLKSRKKIVIWIVIPLILIAGLGAVIIVHFGLKVELKVHFNQKPPVLRQYTTAEWMEMITQSQHQPIAIWEGVRAGSIKKNSSGCGGGLLHFLDTPAKVLEWQVSDLLEKDPMMFLPALASPDKRVLQTGLYIYNRYSMSRLSGELKQKLMEAYRALLNHRDTSLRATGIQKLGEYRQLTVDDIQKGLSDEAGDVRFLTGFWLHILFENSPVYSRDGKIYKGEKETADKFIETKRKLAPILLERLNDPDPFTKSAIARNFRFMLRRHEYTGTGISQELPGFFPVQIDWRRASWHKREETKKIWIEWWQEQGEQALEYAHPPQT